MTPLVVALTFGLSFALLTYSLRDQLKRRFDRDVAWLAHTLWRFSPNPKAAGPLVAAYYAASVVFLLLLLATMSSPPLALIVWSVVFVIPRAWASRAWKKRREAINEQLPAAVRSLAGAVGSGLSLAQSIERMALRAPTPIRTEFFVISNYWKLGSDFTTSMEEAKRRLELPNFTLFASALVVNQSMGGNATATLNRLASSLEAIDSMQREVYAATAEGRTNIKVMAVAPFLMLGITSFMDREAVKLLFTTPVGQLILAFAVLLTLVGSLWASKVVSADV